jgi:mRNA-degrading endonuclease RelE of RelBE toxin-antitoxin system
MKEFKPKFTPTFFKETKKLKSDRRKELEKVVLKILNDPTRGKPLRYSFKVQRHPDYLAIATAVLENEK